MQRQNEKTDHSRKSAKTPSAVSVSSSAEDHRRANHRTHHPLTPKQILNGSDICARFGQLSGQGLPKRMTTGKFVYLGPTGKLPDSPL